jgi:hypothetical protein
MSRGGRVWASLPVDAVTIPVAGLEASLSGYERDTTMSYELTGGLSGLGNEFREFEAQMAAQAASRQQRMMPSAVTAATGRVATPVAVTSRVPVTPTPALTNTLPLLTNTLPVLTRRTPLTVIPSTGSGTPSPNASTAPCDPTNPESYVDARTGACISPGSTAGSEGPSTALVVGGLVVAVGVAAYLMTRKGK